MMLQFFIFIHLAQVVSKKYFVELIVLIALSFLVLCLKDFPSQVVPFLLPYLYTEKQRREHTSMVYTGCYYKCVSQSTCCSYLWHFSYNALILSINCPLVPQFSNTPKESSCLLCQTMFLGWQIVYLVNDRILLLSSSVVLL